MKIGTRIIGNGQYDMYGLLQRCGFHCADLNLADTNALIYNVDENEAMRLIQKEKEVSKRYGIKINQVHGPWQYPIKDDTVEGRTERMDKMKKAVRFTAALSCKYIVIHPIMPFGIEDLINDMAQQTLILNKEFFGELLEEAKKYNVILCLENMPFENFSLSKPSEILRFVNNMNCDSLKICFDTGHAAVFNNENVADAVRKLGNEIKTLHVHDTRLGLDLHLPPTFGVIDWKAFVKALNDIGFDGVFSLEIGEVKQGKELLETTLKYYFDIAEFLTKNRFEL